MCAFLEKARKYWKKLHLQYNSQISLTSKFLANQIASSPVIILVFHFIFDKPNYYNKRKSRKDMSYILIFHMNHTLSIWKIKNGEKENRSFSTWVILWHLLFSTIFKARHFNLFNTRNSVENELSILSQWRITQYYRENIYFPIHFI